MDDRLMKKRLLQEITHQEIPEPMPSLWPALRRQLEPPSRRPILRLTRIGWIAAMLVLSLTLAAGTYAFVLHGDNGDPGMQQIEDDELVTFIGQSVTIDDITVTLNWAYADAHRIALNYDIEGHSPYTEGNQPGTAPLPPAPLFPGLLVDDQGHTFPMMSGSGDGETTTITMLTGASASYDPSGLEDTPAALQLHYEIRVGLEDPPESLDGSEEAASDDESTQSDLPFGMDRAVGPFVFDFSVPFYPALELTPNTTVEANGVSMTLAGVSITPSMTHAEVCASGLPEASAPWEPVAALETHDDTIALDDSDVLNDSEDRACFKLVFPAAYDGTEQRWTIVLSHFEIPPVFGEEFQAAFAEYGIAIESTDEGFWYTTSIPEDVDFEQVRAEIQRRLGQTLSGPWEMTFTVPESDR